MADFWEELTSVFQMVFDNPKIVIDEKTMPVILWVGIPSLT